MLRRIRRTFDAVLSRARFERDLRDELRAHLQERTDDLIAGGLSPTHAARQARVEFGSIERYKEACRDIRGFAVFRPLHGVAGDVRLAARRLRATPQFFVFATLSLAVGIGVTTAMYSILYALAWKPLAFSDPSHVVFLAARGGGSAPLLTQLLSVPDFRDLRGAQHTLSSIAASAEDGQPLVTPSSTDFVGIEGVSGDYFHVVGVSPRLGRTIDARDETTEASVVVLNFRTWQKRFDSDRDILGRTIQIGGRPFEVIGVAARGFDGIHPPQARAAVWVPLSCVATLPGARNANFNDRNAPRLTVIGRLADGRTARDAAFEMDAIGKRFDAVAPIRRLPAGVDRRQPAEVVHRAWWARAATDTGARTDKRTAALVLALVALVLLVACTNLANLMIARGTLRQQEFAIRRALGASRWRLVRELCAEAALVALTGGAGALFLVTLLLRLATVEIPTPSMPLVLEPQLNVQALIAATIALLLSLAVFGVEPALQLTRRRSIVPDFAAGPNAIGMPRSHRQHAFIRWQVAIAGSLLLVAAILLKIIAVEASHDTGIDLDRLGMATVDFSLQSWNEARARAALSAAQDDLRGQPSIERVAFSSGMPFGSLMTPLARVAIPGGRPVIAHVTDDMAYTLAASPGIFQTLGVSILRGRAFDGRDDASAPHVAVVSDHTARSLFGTSDAVGRQLSIEMWGRAPAERYTVVGIARDTDTGRILNREGLVVYLPLAQHYEPRLVVVARTSGHPAAAARLIQSAVHRAAPDLGMAASGPASMLMAGAFLVARVAAAIGSGLGLLALLLSMTGLYGIQSHIVTRRTREVGVRMAMGASVQQIQRMVLAEGYRPVFEGIAVGLLLGVLARALLRAYVNGSIQILDPIAFTLMPVPLLAAAFVACYFPARRAARIDPNEALRQL